MNKYLTFIFGAVTGSIVTALIVKKKYEQQANEEIKSVVQRFRDMERHFNESHQETNNDISKIEDNEQKEYHNIVSNYKNNEVELTELDTTPVVGPYVISPEEIGENGYDICSLTYYIDDILLNDSDGTVIPNPEGFFGDDWKDHFGEYEDDAIHFRNDEESVDYEILKSNKSFHEVYRDSENEED